MRGICLLSSSVMFIVLNELQLYRTAQLFPTWYKNVKWQSLLFMSSPKDKHSSPCDTLHHYYWFNEVFLYCSGFTCTLLARWVTICDYSEWNDLFHGWGKSKLTQAYTSNFQIKKTIETVKVKNCSKVLQFNKYCLKHKPPFGHPHIKIAII